MPATRLMGMPNVRLALAQTNPTVGDILGNSEQIYAAVIEASKQGANLVCFGEMALTGYPIEDLAARPEFLERSEAAVQSLATHLQASGLAEVVVVLGHAAKALASTDSATEHLETHDWSIAQNVASVIKDGKVIGRYAKHHLPNYSVFDEYRNFVPGNALLTFEHLGMRFSTVICEDIWQNGGPVADISNAATDVLLVLNGSPFETNKSGRRVELAREIAEQHACDVAYVNLVGGQDDLVFDGSSFLVTTGGEVATRARAFESDLVFVDFDVSTKRAVRVAEELGNMPELESVWNALVLGLRDYVKKNGFNSVVLGLSGGIDSAVCAAIARDALGKHAVFGVAMPSRFSSKGSVDDAYELANRLEISIRDEPIESAFGTFQSQLQLDGLAAENLQARIRGVILMSLSNAEGHLTLTTGNKTELAVGYSTIYGDSVGGFAPIKDVAKTMVWELARWRNASATASGEIAPIPENSINKAPSAELRPDQTDQDSLPDYETLDEILELYINQHLSMTEICSKGFDGEVVSKVVTLVDRSEWKRRQGAIGPKISGMAFGRDRRLPITNSFKSK
ncbi:MAG: hypothetical protein RLZ28_102 [Actinomycetota bacterium]